MTVRGPTASRSISPSKARASREVTSIAAMDSDDSAFQYASLCDAGSPRVDQACMRTPLP
jgi:hypothetical protein